jgi:hypothetical protein
MRPDDGDQIGGERQVTALQDSEEIDTEDDGDDEIEGALDVVRFRLTGRTMLIMNSNAGVNPLHPLVKEKNVLTSKQNKSRTEEDIMEIYRLDFVLGMYHDKDLGPYIPGVNLEAAIIEAASLNRLGSKAKAAIRVMEDKIPLQYKGPRDADKLWKARTFADIRPTRLKKSSSLMKCRPCFPAGWVLEASASFNAGVLDRDAVTRLIEKIGDVGVCDYRKRYGKSRVEII